MKRPSKSSLLDDTLRLLVRHFGSKEVRSTLDRVSHGQIGLEANTRAKAPAAGVRPATIVQTLESLRNTDAAKYRVLNNFYERLKAREVLPEAEDIRQFALLVGLKQIGGKSRKDLVPKLLTSMLESSQEKLEQNVQMADSISDRERQRGFSILTDKLLGEK